MRVTVFGASGKVGRLVVRQLLDDGWEVAAFIHNASPFPKTKHLRLVRGDIHDPEDVKRAISDSEVVISALGSWGTKQKDIVSSGIKHIIAAMEKQGTKRVISLTGSDASAPQDKSSPVQRISHFLIKLTPARRILEDGERHIALLQASRLNWTVVRSPIMNTRGNPASYSLGSTKPKPWATIHRQSVAQAMVAVIDDLQYSKQAPYLKRTRS